MEGALETRALASLSVDEDRDAAEGRKPLLRDAYALLQAATGGRETEVRQLVVRGADVTITDWGGRTPLHEAGGHAAVVEQLLAAGAAADAKDGDGATPMHQAAWKGHAAVVEQLLAASAAADAETNSGETPLHWAAGSTPRSIAQGAVLAMLVAAEEEAQRLRNTMFAMGLQERLGAASVARELVPELLRMVVELVYPGGQRPLSRGRDHL